MATKNAIAMFTAREDQRHNIAQETETNRHNVVTEGETHRHNIVTEDQGQQALNETNRHNLKTEELGVNQLAESHRHNLQTEELGLNQLREQSAHNRATEAIDKLKAEKMGVDTKYNTFKQMGLDANNAEYMSMLDTMMADQQELTEANFNRLTQILDMSNDKLWNYLAAKNYPQLMRADSSKFRDPKLYAKIASIIEKIKRK